MIALMEWVNGPKIIYIFRTLYFMKPLLYILLVSLLTAIENWNFIWAVNHQFLKIWVEFQKMRVIHFDIRSKDWYNALLKGDLHWKYTLPNFTSVKVPIIMQTLSIEKCWLVSLNYRPICIEESHLILFESASRKIKSEEESRIQMKFERCRLLCAFEQCIVMQCMFALSTNAKMHIFINGFSSTNSVRMSYQSENLFYTYIHSIWCKIGWNQFEWEFFLLTFHEILNICTMILHTTKFN